MSKYIYATVYEQFTGLKPPEPKSNKPRRRRGFGHPYRMRLNIQDEDQQDQEELLEQGSDFEPEQESMPTDDFDSQSHFLPGMALTSPTSRVDTGHTRRKSHYTARRNDTQRAVNYQPAVVEEPKCDKQPKVTYKKRRSLTAASI
ncbi:hypothetical protein EOPP23_17110 [Endozoicomonas sp. OPT23]|uniref:hypothetical protein n=1 Tax=Endozoicomonas sp. OPT23 TaxID=2072845 RepID=UPI00129A7E3D|nr:hypothetical protein [Endozoicomonas sp. OPT23]MRI34704.1 hypothetical protein [Endozoicomonas sp. OPT23]